MEDEEINNPLYLQPKVENPMPTSHFPTTPLTPYHYPSPSPPPAPESPHNTKPQYSPPLEAQTTKNPIEEKEQANPTTTDVQLTENPSTKEHQTP